MTDYFALPTQCSWIEYLRGRLPYSFKSLKEQRQRYRRRFILSDPELNLGSDYHNFWRRGNIYYMSALMLDRYILSDFWREQIQSVELGLFKGARQAGRVPPDFSPTSFYNVIQMEKVWRFARQDNLNRERVVMTNCVQAVELCLKAILSHVAHHQSGEFVFDAGHDVKALYRELPKSLQDELSVESRKFAKTYAKLRSRVSAEMVDLDENRFSQDIGWTSIRKGILDDEYTVFLDGTDPGRRELDDDWLESALNETLDGEYHRYSPEETRDEYPVQQISFGLMLGRFLYEHLFPVRLLDSS